MALALLSFAVYTFYPQVKETGSNLLVNADFNDQLNSWDLVGDPAHFTIQGDSLFIANDGEPSSLFLTQTFSLEKGIDFLRIFGQFSIQDIIQGERQWYNANAALRFMDLDGQKIKDYPFFSGRGTHAWLSFDQVVHVPAETHFVKVSYRIYQSKGRISLRHLAVYQGKPQSLFSFLRAILLVLWILVLSWSVWPLWAFFKQRPLYGLLIFGVLVFVGLCLSLPKSYLQLLTTPISVLTPEAVLIEWRRVLIWIGHYKPVSSLSEVSKLGHLVVFMLITIVLILGRGVASILSMLSVIVMMVVCSEAFQLFLGSRTATYLDMIVDLLGVFLGGVFLLPLLIYQAYKERND